MRRNRNIEKALSQTHWEFDDKFDSVFNTQSLENLYGSETAVPGEELADREWRGRLGQSEYQDREALLGNLWDTVSRGADTVTTGIAGAVGAFTDCARIEDRTHLTPKHKRGKSRDMNKVYALVLHQTAGNQKNEPPNRYDIVTAHFVIKPNGQILQLHPLSARLNASHGLNAGSVAVEFAGNFPDTKGKRYVYPSGASPRGQLTAEQIEAGRCLVRHLIRTMGLTHILAHRQSRASRANDPGPDIWYSVGQWAVENLGLKDGGPNFKVGTGNPIPDLWRTWGRVKPQPELSAEIDPDSPDHVRWLQRALNHTLGLRLSENGIEDAATRSALRSFQLKHGRDADGELNEEIEALLIKDGATRHHHADGPVMRTSRASHRYGYQQGARA